MSFNSKKKIRKFLG